MESTTTSFPPGRRTSMSGRSAPSSPLRSCSARGSRSGRPSPPSRRRCAAGSPPRSRAWPGRLQRRYEVAGLLAQRAHALAELAEHLRELALRLAALALQPPDLALHPSQLLLHRRDQALDLLGAPGHLAGRALLLGAACLLDPRASESPVADSTSSEIAFSSWRIRSRSRRSSRAAQAASASNPAAVITMLATLICNDPSEDDGPFNVPCAPDASAPATRRVPGRSPRTSRRRAGVRQPPQTAPILAAEPAVGAGSRLTSRQGVGILRPRSPGFWAGSVRRGISIHRGGCACGHVPHV